MLKKPIPPIYRVCCDGNDKSWVQNKYSVKEYPTSIIFSRDGTPRTTLIGASWSLLEGLFDSQMQIINNQPKGLQVNCWCSSPYRQVNNQNDEEIFCLNCGNANQSEGLLDTLMGQDNSKVYVCQNGTHCRCLNCGFLIDNHPSRYKDYRGKSYLYEKKTQHKLPKCKMGHQSVYLKNFIQTKEFQCFKCQKDSILNNVFGAGFCQQCNKYCCSRCIGFEDDGLQKVAGQIINHTAQATAEEGERCICNRLFKKVYNTRDYINNVLEDKPEGEDRTQQLLESVYQMKKRTWNCIICQRTKKDGELHLACFNCPKMFSVTNSRINLEICIECAIGTDLLNRQLESKITQLPSDMICKANHPVVRTKLSHNNQQMTYDCIGCRKTFYIFSERFYCKTCKTNVCYNCSSKHLINKNPPKCLRKCNQNHNLKLNQPPQTLKMCDGCKITIRKNHFACPLNCGFDLCLQCAATPPGVDTTNNRMQHINHQEVKRKMQEYERGWIDQIADAINEQGQNQQENNDDLGQVVDGLKNGIQQLNDWWDS